MPCFSALPKKFTGYKPERFIALPKYSTLVFDLDGTLADPATGFVRCMNYALTKFDYTPLPDHDITRHIGPPLEQTIQLLIGSDDSKHVDEVTAAYRERYAELGYLENEIYSGIHDMLGNLAAANIPMGVCTSKHHAYAHKVVEALKLDPYFNFVDGAKGKMVKSQQLEQLLNDKAIDGAALMIGDRSVDLTAAHTNSLKSAGVLWGYGSLEELSAESPSHLFNNPADLAAAIMQD